MSTNKFPEYPIASNRPYGFYDLLIDDSLALELRSLPSHSQIIDLVTDPDAIRERLIDAVRRELEATLDGEGAPLSDAECLE